MDFPQSISWDKLSSIAHSLITFRSFPSNTTHTNDTRSLLDHINQLGRLMNVLHSVLTSTIEISVLHNVGVYFSPDTHTRPIANYVLCLSFTEKQDWRLEWQQNSGLACHRVWNIAITSTQGFSIRWMKVYRKFLTYRKFLKLIPGRR